MGLTCLNCKADVAEGEGHFFAETFVCPRCYFVAERLLVQGEKELRMMLTLLKESVRLAIIRGQLSFAEQSLEELPKHDLLMHLGSLVQETRKEKLCPTTSTSKTPCRETTKSPATTPAAGGQRSSG